MLRLFTNLVILLGGGRRIEDGRVVFVHQFSDLIPPSPPKKKLNSNFRIVTSFSFHISTSIF